MPSSQPWVRVQRGTEPDRSAVDCAVFHNLRRATVCQSVGNMTPSLWVWRQISCQPGERLHGQPQPDLQPASVHQSTVASANSHLTDS